MRRLGAEPALGRDRLAQLVGFTRKAIVESRFAHAQGGLCRGAAAHFGLELAAELPRVIRDASLLGGLPVVVDLDESARELALGS